MIVRLVIGALLIAWGLYNANLFFRKQGNRTTSAVAALVLFLLGVGLVVQTLYFHFAR